jgi:hypothetical protein
MGWRKIRYRIGCQALRLKGQRRARVAFAALGVLGLLTCLTVAIGAATDPGAAGSAWDVAWKTGIGFCLFFTGIVGNLAADWCRSTLDSLPRDAIKANRNHHLAGIVGESVRVLMLALASSDEERRVATPPETNFSLDLAAREALTVMAVHAPAFWREVVEDADPSRRMEFAELYEPRLSRFVLDPTADAMTPTVWLVFLDRLFVFACSKSGTQLAKPSPKDLEVTARMLGREFGHSFREALKWDSTHDGLGWAGMQLQLAGEILRRVNNLEEVRTSPKLAEAMSALQERYGSELESLKKQFNAISDEGKTQHREMLGRLDTQHVEIKAEFRGLNTEVRQVRAGMDHANQTLTHLIAPSLQRSAEEMSRLASEVAQFKRDFMSRPVARSHGGNLDPSIDMIRLDLETVRWYLAEQPHSPPSAAEQKQLDELLPDSESPALAQGVASGIHWGLRFLLDEQMSERAKLRTVAILVKWTCHIIASKGMPVSGAASLRPTPSLIAEYANQGDFAEAEQRELERLLPSNAGGQSDFYVGLLAGLNQTAHAMTTLGLPSESIERDLALLSAHACRIGWPRSLDC